MVPHGATVRVLCLKCPRTCGHPRTSQDGPTWGYCTCPMSQVSQDMWTSQDGPTWGYCTCPMSEVSQYLGDIPGHPGDGPTWGYPMCPMSEVSQYLGTSQDIPRMVPHGATLLCVVCLKCPRTWGHPRTSRGSHMGLLYYVSYV